MKGLLDLEEYESYQSRLKEFEEKEKATKEFARIEQSNRKGQAWLARGDKRGRRLR